MERYTNCSIFIKADLLLQKDSLEALKDFLSGENNLDAYCTLDYSPEKRQICLIRYPDIYKFAPLALIVDRLANNYMLIPYASLVRLLES